MHRIRVFLASSITEFSQERVILGDFVRTLNDILVETDMYIRLEKSEDITNAIDLFRKQNQYNAVIRESDYFVMLVGRAVGAYTMEEYELACGSEKKGMRILFRGKAGESEERKAPKGLGEQNTPSAPDGFPDAGAAITPEAFRERLEEEKRMYMDCNSPDGMKLALLMMLTAEREIARSLLFRDGEAWLDGRRALSLLETPVYRKEGDLRKAILHKQEAERAYVQCLRAGDAKSMQKADLLKEEITQLTGRIAQQENDLLEMFAYINQSREMSNREREAQRYLAQGDLPAATLILQDPLRQAERQTAEENILRLRGQVKTQIHRNREEVLGLLGGEIPDTLPEKAEFAYLIEMLLRENSDLAQEFRIGFAAIGDYAKWLLLNGKEEEAARHIRRLEALLDLYGAGEEELEMLKRVKKFSRKK